MKEQVRLNADIAGGISDFEAIMKEFLLKTKLYRMLFVAKSLDFDGYRDYSTLDDATSIDWKASVKANKILVKKYKEEENLKVVFLVDMGENMVLGSTKKLKCEYAAEVVAALSHFIMSSGDKVGVIFFGKEVIEYLSPAKNDNHFSLIVEILTNSANYSSGSKIENAMTYLLNYVNSNAVIMVSDFSSFNKNAREALNLVASKYETMALIIKDPLDKTLPNISGELILEDPATGEQILVNPKVAKKAYEKNIQQKEKFMMEAFSENAVDYVEFMTDIPFAPKLAEFLKERIKKEGPQ